MNSDNRLEQIMAQIPDIEKPILTKTQSKILSYLKDQRLPKLPKTISIVLNLKNHSVRARLSELKTMGYVCQPNKQANNPKEKICGYSLVRL